MYAKYFKRMIDFILSLIALVVLSPVLAVLMILGAVFMRGNPFFTQPRPGKNERIFKLIKFRTMDNRKDADGNLLPDEVRLNEYGKFLRSTSLDAQAHGRNALSWEDKFAMDVWYTKHVTFIGDIKILIDTIKTVLNKSGISSETSATMEEFMGTPDGVKAKWN